MNVCPWPIGPARRHPFPTFWPSGNPKSFFDVHGVGFPSSWLFRQLRRMIRYSGRSMWSAPVLPLPLRSGAHLNIDCFTYSGCEFLHAWLVLNESWGFLTDVAHWSNILNKALWIWNKSMKCTPKSGTLCSLFSPRDSKIKIESALFSWSSKASQPKQLSLLKIIRDNFFISICKETIKL